MLNNHRYADVWTFLKGSDLNYLKACIAMTKAESGKAGGMLNIKKTKMMSNTQANTSRLSNNCKL